jgi:hypothetical protein
MEKDGSWSLLTPITRISDDLNLFFKHILNKKGRRVEGEN